MVYLLPYAPLQGGGCTPLIIMLNELSVSEPMEESKYRIRKLTPTECFRLMGVEDDRISILLGAGISNTQLYKLAGNSIVEDVLYHLFRKMFIEVDEEGADRQLF